MANVIVFVDFWNFQLSWNALMKPEDGSDQNYVKIGWRGLSATLLGEIPGVLPVPTSDALVFKGTHVYASVNPNPGSPDAKLKGFLSNTLGQMPGYTVNVRDRRFKRDTCRHCDKSIDRMVEKGVDTSIVTDLFSGAINSAYDIAVLVSNDSDFVPAIKIIQERLNKQVIHVGFRSGGDYVRNAAWGHIILDGDVSEKIRD